MKENQEEKLKEIEEEFKLFIKKTKNGWKRPPIQMRDGVVMSVQASSFHYCLPRESLLEDYLCYEIGYPSKVIEQLRDYAEIPVENDEELLKSVYPFVPKEVIIDILLEHGGIDMEKMFNPKDQLDDLRGQKGKLEDRNLRAQKLINEFMAQLGNILGDE